MRIQKLELHGFKSFPERTAFHFGTGVSCIVGPNGSGKSNVVDAIKWCMGEQSAMSLRGSEMQDVIFAGSTERKPVGFAEVQLTFTAEGGEPFPGEYARFTEIQVGRRLHRSGTSEYLINRTKVRRRDIIDLFLDTGIGNNLYCFIEQGRIGQIVHARPEQRRTLIDEAAGISRYKIRRAEAQKRLEATASQLDRAADVADEMARRLRTLANQVAKAAEFRRVRAVIRQLEISLSLARYAALSADRRALRADFKDVVSRLEGLTRELSRREVDLTSRREETEVVEAGVSSWRDEVAELDARLRETEGANKFAEQTATELRERITRTYRSLQDALQEKTESEAESEAAEQERNELEQAIRAAEEQIIVLEQTVSERAAARRELQRVWEQLERESAEAAVRLEAEQRRLSEVQTRRDALPALMAERQSLFREAEQEEQRLSQRIHETDGVIASLGQMLTARQEQLQSLEEDLAKLGEMEERARRSLKVAEEALEVARETHEREEHAEASRLRKAEQAERSFWQGADRERTRRIAEVQRSTDAQRAAEEQRASQALVAARRRADRWIREAERWEQRKLQAWRTQEVGQQGQARQREQRDLQAEESHWKQELGRVEREAERAAKERVSAAEGVLQSGRESLRKAEQTARVRVQERDQARGQAEAFERELASVAAQMLALSGAASGASVAEAFPEARPLADWFTSDEAAPKWVASVFQDRLIYPVLRTEQELLRAAEIAREAGKSSVVFLSEQAEVEPGTVRDHLLSGVTLVDDLPAALEHYQRLGGPVVVRDTGERIDADGVVGLGAGGSAGQALLALKEQRRELEEELARIQERLPSVEEEVQASIAAVAAARQHVQIAEDRWHAVRVESRKEVEHALREARQAEAQALQTLRQRIAADQRARQEAYSSALERRRSQVEQRLQDLRDQGRQATERVDRDSKEAVIVLREKLEAHRETVRAEIEQDLKDRGDRCAAAVSEARAAFERVRMAGREVLNEHQTRRSVAREHWDEARKRLETKQAERAALQQVTSQQEVERARAQADRDGLAAERKQADVRMQELVAQRQALMQEQGALDESSAEVTRHVDDARQRSEQRQQQLEGARAARQDAEEADEAAREALSAARVALVALQERRVAAEQARETAVERAERAVKRAQEALGHVEELRQNREQALADRERLSKELQELTQKRGEAWDRLERERVRLRALRDGIAQAETALRELGQQREQVERERMEVEQRITQVKNDIDATRTRMDERYQVSLPGLLDRIDATGRLVLEPDASLQEPFVIGTRTLDPVQPVWLDSSAMADEDGIRAWVDDLEGRRARLKRLGEVNLAAFEEYEEVVERHADLEQQRSDLEDSVNRIRAAIAKMNRTCRQRFRDTFDRVNANFQECYPRLVGGGRARLSLTDEEDLLETGVDIFVQPPGKRLQNLTLLSGGEKAMTAIALILALFQVKPSPFCLLDEVDAPLDEANGARFNDMLKELSQLSQFIVITHNRKTMECADTLYGVTMATPGVSCLVSVQIDAVLQGSG